MTAWWALVVGAAQQQVGCGISAVVCRRGEDPTRQSDLQSKTRSLEPNAMSLEISKWMTSHQFEAQNREAGVMKAGSVEKSTVAVAELRSDLQGSLITSHAYICFLQPGFVISR